MCPLPSVPPDSPETPSAVEAGQPETPSGSAPSIWALKPWWCQPWSILLTGIVVPLASWFLMNRWWITLPLSLAVLAWWGLFLVVVPAEWQRDHQA